MTSEDLARIWLCSVPCGLPESGRFISAFDSSGQGLAARGSRSASFSFARAPQHCVYRAYRITNHVTTSRSVASERAGVRSPRMKSAVALCHCFFALALSIWPSSAVSHARNAYVGQSMF